VSTNATLVARVDAAGQTSGNPLAALVTRLRDDRSRDRIVSAVAVGALHALIFYMLVTGFGGTIITRVGEQMKLFDVVEPPPAPPVTPAPPKQGETHKARTPNPEGAASPKNKRETPKEIVAPPPKLPVLQPLPAAPVAGQGQVAAAGAADTPGPGTGAGGVGSGTGSGRYGDGTGGGGGGIASHARWIRGRIRDSDYPIGAFEAGAGGVVYLRFVVQPDGSVTNCRVTRSSGRADLDRVTCRLIEARFRYRPARDYAGRPIAETIDGEQHWETSRRPDVYEDAVEVPYWR
jgi:protein TonB